MTSLADITDETIAAETDEDVRGLRDRLQAEWDRRLLILAAEDKADTLNREYLDATGVEDGDPWRQPTGAHDAYPKDSLVLHNGKTWVSLTPANVWEPGVSGWRENVEEGSGPADWVQPTGGHDAYAKGDRVSFEGSVYESLVDANTWSPTEYPAGWKSVLVV